MNTETVFFDLREAQTHLGELVEKIAAGKLAADDSPVLAVELAHLMDHLCRAWNTKGLTPEQRGSLSQEEFERASNTVPNFLGEKVIGDFALT